MAKTYQHLFFDLDHTLWDFEANSRITLSEMYGRHCLDEVTGVTHEVFYQTYIAVNNKKWQLYSEGKINKQALRTERFIDTFKTFGYDDTSFCRSFEEEYLATCPHQTQLVPGTLELLDYLKGRYDLHIITNGFVESQDIKLSRSGMKPYFTNVFSSEAIGVNKPAPAIFHESLRRAGAGVDHSLMIGDNLQADIVGAQSCGLDQVYYNPSRTAHTETPTYEVDHLLQLKEIL